MDSKSAIDKTSFIKEIKANSYDLWSNLSEGQQSLLKKIWLILTYKWQWQIILNAPFFLIWILDQTIPAIHSFDMQIISLLPIPIYLKRLFGFS